MFKRTHRPGSAMPTRKTMYFKVAKAIFEKEAFNRLRDITFMGVLSPRYMKLRNYPFTGSNTKRFQTDQSRAHHSVAVARLTSDAIHSLQLSDRSYIYAVAWGLLHDIATWPLSHTGEAAFAEATGVNAHQLRTMMIYGSDKISRRLHLHTAIRDAGIDHETLVALFDKTNNTFSDDMTILHSFVHSVITPDTLEGMYRSGITYGIPTITYKHIYNNLHKDILSDLVMDTSLLPEIREFWIFKQKIYRSFINKDKTIDFESSWSASIMNEFHRKSLQETLELSEAELIHKISSKWALKTNRIHRYKEPLEYKISSRYRSASTQGSTITLNGLKSVFVRDRLPI